MYAEKHAVTASLPVNSKYKHLLVNLRSHFWDAKGVILIDYLEQGHTISAQYYTQLITKKGTQFRKIGK